MRRAVIALATLLVASPTIAAGSAADVLVQACQGLKRQADRNTCLAAAVKSVAAQSQAAQAAPHPPSPLDAARARSAKALEASRSIQSVIGAGVSLVQYQPYVLQLSIALDQFRSAAQTQEERDAAGLLAEALQAYTDAATYWQADIEFYARNGNRLAYMGGQPVGLTGTGYILDRYNVPIQNSDVWGLQKGAPLNVALVTIWQYAKGKTDEAADAIENVGLPVHGGQASGGAAPSNSAASNVTSAVTKELDPPWSMRVSASFTGGSYTQPNYSAKRLDGSVAGVNVTAYASNGDWARVTPVGGPEQWIPMSQLSNPD